MKVVIQRVLEASVTINQKIEANISQGLLILLGIGLEDTLEDVDWLCEKIAKLRIFSDQNGVMNQSVVDVDGEIIIVSQFTLQALTKKGNRPSYIKAANPQLAIPLYELFKEKLSYKISKPVQSGIFGADMKVQLVNDGPVTIVIDSKDKI